MLPAKSSHFFVVLFSTVIVNFFACSPDRSAQNWVRKTERHWAKLEKKQPAWLETLDAKTLNAQLQFLSTSQQQAVTWLVKPLNPAIKKNIENLGDRLKRAQTRLELQQHDPSVYNLGLRLRTLYGLDSTLETEEVEMLEKYLDQAPHYYRLARQKLVSPETSRCDSAVQQHITSVAFLKGPLSKLMKQDQMPVEKTRVLYKKINSACFYMKDYLAWCRSVAFEANDQ